MGVAIRFVPQCPLQLFGLLVGGLQHYLKTATGDNKLPMSSDIPSQAQLQHVRLGQLCMLMTLAFRLLTAASLDDVFDAVTSLCATRHICM